MKEEQINPKTFYMLDNKDIKEIEIRTVGLLDIFGKIIIDITFKNNTKKRLVGISPVDTAQIKEWLEKDMIYEKAKMYNF